jgi:hypothetical protein
VGGIRPVREERGRVVPQGRQPQRVGVRAHQMQFY